MYTFIYALKYVNYSFLFENINLYLILTIILYIHIYTHFKLLNIGDICSLENVKALGIWNVNRIYNNNIVSNIMKYAQMKILIGKLG